MCVYVYYIYIFLQIIVLVSDNHKEICERLKKRGEGSDIVRSHWPFYPKLQDIMYRTLYPNSFIVFNQITDIDILIEVLNELNYPKEVIGFPNHVYFPNNDSYKSTHNSALGYREDCKFFYKLNNHVENSNV